jgi:hypothetical protein
MRRAINATLLTAAATALAALGVDLTSETIDLAWQSTGGKLALAASILAGLLFQDRNGDGQSDLLVYLRGFAQRHGVGLWLALPAVGLLSSACAGPQNGLEQVIDPATTPLSQWYVCEPTTTGTTFPVADRIELYCDGTWKQQTCRSSIGVAYECRFGVSTVLPYLGGTEVRNRLTAGVEVGGAWAAEVRSCIRVGPWDTCLLDATYGGPLGRDRGGEDDGSGEGSGLSGGEVP